MGYGQETPGLWGAVSSEQEGVQELIAELSRAVINTLICIVTL